MLVSWKVNEGQIAVEKRRKMKRANRAVAEEAAVAKEGCTYGAGEF